MSNYRDGVEALKAMCAGFDTYTIAMHLIENGLWEGRTPESGATRIRNCLSPEKREFFHFSEIIAISKFTGNKDALFFFEDGVGHSRSHPLDIQEQIANCEQMISDAVTKLSVAGNKLQQLKADPDTNKVTTLRPRAAHFSKQKYPLQEF